MFLFFFSCCVVVLEHFKMAERFFLYNCWKDVWEGSLPFWNSCRDNERVEETVVRSVCLFVSFVWRCLFQGLICLYWSHRAIAGVFTLILNLMLRNYTRPSTLQYFLCIDAFLYMYEMMRIKNNNRMNIIKSLTVYVTKEKKSTLNQAPAIRRALKDGLAARRVL